MRTDVTHSEELAAEVEDLGTHEVLSLDSTQDDDVTPNTLVTENTNTAVSVETGISLRDLRRRR